MYFTCPAQNNVTIFIFTKSRKKKCVWIGSQFPKCWNYLVSPKVYASQTQHGAAPDALSPINKTSHSSPNYIPLTIGYIFSDSALERGLKWRVLTLPLHTSFHPFDDKGYSVPVSEWCPAHELSLAQRHDTAALELCLFLASSVRIWLGNWSKFLFTHCKQNLLV